MFKLELFISIFYHALSTSCSFSLKAVKMLPPLVSGWMGGFGTAPISSLACMFMHQISALCESPLSRHKLNLGLMRAGSPLCTCSEGEGGRGEEQKGSGRGRERAGVKRERYSDFLHRLCGPGRLFLCVFKSIAKTRRKEIVLSTASGLCWAYIFKPPLFHA